MSTPRANAVAFSSFSNGDPATAALGSHFTLGLLYGRHVMRNEKNSGLFLSIPHRASENQSPLTPFDKILSTFSTCFVKTLHLTTAFATLCNRPYIEPFL